MDKRPGIFSSSEISPTARKLVRRLRRTVDFLAMRAGRIASQVPLSDCYGFDRGTPIDRFYIESFLADHSADIGGQVLEVGDDSYSRRFAGRPITRQDILHIHANNPAASIVGDLADPGTLPAKTFDCLILTQTLQYVFDLRQAVANIRQSLRRGGVVLITVPAISPMCEDEWKKGHYWLFTVGAVERLLAAEFGRDKISVHPFGNLYAATAFLHGAALEEISMNKLRRVDDDYPITITARAVA